ncbi:MAG: prephenate dehydrogenase/arogenate dehydrogenase family protein [Gammaproteobacteria bacterium]|nr:prephenate dehydrogenase/arogenate dehydrogenase family protein [Gammaproteobacteria bacterium]NNM01658.1 prephenate dehydrogenase/arogenate dehydrogenase family protein [Gammaproteobacteria bacterium]
MANRLALIGIGLIGSSLARAVKRNRAARELIAFDSDADAAARAVELGIVDTVSSTVEGAVRDADLVVIAVRSGAVPAVLPRLAAALHPDAVVTDVSSVKGPIVAAARDALGPAFPAFVPGHPIAGTEHSGVEAGFAELFDNHRVVLTPLDDTRASALARVRDLWEAVGAEVVLMDTLEHDRVLAATSHLPHMVAYALVDCLAQPGDGDAMLEFAAGGFADFTRIASSSPAMWADIAAANSAALLDAMDRMQASLTAIRAAIADGDEKTLLEMFGRASATRARLIDRRAV